MQRTVKWYNSLDSLLASSGAAPAREAEQLSKCSVNPEWPVDIWLERDALLRGLRSALRGLAKATKRADLPDEVRAELKQHIAQRRSFVRWLRAGGDNVFVRVSPVATFDPPPIQAASG